MAVAVLLMLSSVAFADNGGLYLSGKGGIGFMRGDKSLAHNQTTGLVDEETKWKSDTFSYGGSVGWNWIDTGAPIRTEVEYYDHGTLKMEHSDDNATFSISTKIQTLQFNLFYDFYNTTSFIPYIGGGVGIANIKSTGGGKSATNVSYSLFGGAAYKLTDSLLLDMMYRIDQFGSRKFEWQDTNNSYDGKIKNMYSISGTLGLRYQF